MLDHDKAVFGVLEGGNEEAADETADETEDEDVALYEGVVKRYIQSLHVENQSASVNHNAIDSSCYTRMRLPIRGRRVCLLNVSKRWVIGNFAPGVRLTLHPGA